MCGIFGIIIKPQSTLRIKGVRKILEKIAVFSESRGKDSSGIAIQLRNKQLITIIKGDIPIHQLLKSKAFKQEIKLGIDEYNKSNGFIAFGHARLVTNGSQLHEVNNQPVIKEGIIIIHNGIIVNVDELWMQHTQLKREYFIDTEIIPALIRKEMQQQDNLVTACCNAFNQIIGTYSVAMMFNDLDQFILGTNNGSLYYLTDNENFITFTSEKYFLERLKRESCFKHLGQNLNIQPLPKNNGLVISLTQLTIKPFSIKGSKPSIPISKSSVFNIQKHIIDNYSSKREVVIDLTAFSNRSKEQNYYSLLENNSEAISLLRRCTKCLLPETIPFITYDQLGVCNYCNNYTPKNQYKTIDELKTLIEPYRKKGDTPDCIVPFSGGRDSTYTLHFVKEVLGLNPIAYTYDWGMVTDLARRNAARVCGKLGIENIIVAADIRMKRENIRKNVLAWLKKPHLGMVPLFMAGDKYFFYYSNKIQLQNKIKLSVWGSNPLENTDFKLGFAGIPPQFIKKRIDDVKSFNKIKLASFFGRNYITNPSYLNDSLIDTFGSFISRYLITRQGYLQLFDYIKWDESEIESLILNEYNWEKSIDTNSTWRIGDGTAAFYNYIYYTVAGFSEYDTFRSNQIREGQMTRSEGLDLVNIENRPRYENLRWYIDIIGLDFRTTIESINKITKLYKNDIAC
jgi:extradiol dioxygenase family protein